MIPFACSNTHVNSSFNGWGLTLIDSLDTMWIMGLQNEFEDSLSTVANLNFTQDEVHAPHLSQNFPLTSLYRDCMRHFLKQSFDI